MRLYRSISFVLPLILLTVISLIFDGVRNPAPVHAAPVRQGQAPTQPQGLPLGAIRDYQLIAPLSGWLLLDQDLWATNDGGQGWVNITPPQAALIWAVDFVDNRFGWAFISPPAGSSDSSSFFQVSRTVDGGSTWEYFDFSEPVFTDVPGLQPVDVQLDFLDLQKGSLYVKRPTSSNFDLGDLFETSDGGSTWIKTMENQPIPGGNESNPTPANEPGLSGGAVNEPTFLPDGTGWGVEMESDCSADLKAFGQPCGAVERLVRTDNSGQTWNPIVLPEPYQPLQTSAPEALATGHGFDKCEVPSLTQLQTWWNYSPYGALNIYIGGSSRSCSNKALSASYLSSIDQQGWTLIPTWVGLQAACTSYTNRMSYNLSTAYQQGVDEANAAVSVAAGLRLWRQALYFDLEAFDTTNSTCLNAAKAFMDGWVNQLHVLGYVAGVYGSPCRSGLADFWGLANRPDAVWIAHWIYDKYDPAATVWTSICSFSNTYWPQNQRLRQYSGGHSETWGGTSIIIDSNVMDGFVAQAFGQPSQICPQPGSPAKAGVILYTAADFDCYNRQAGFGYTWYDRPGQQNLSAFFENRVSSIYIPPGWSVRLYDGLNRTGGKVCLNATDTNFAGNLYDNGLSMDNSASSIEVFDGANCLSSSGVTPPLDNLPPQVMITSHSSGGFISSNGLPIVIQADLQDSGSGISHAQYFVGFTGSNGWTWQSLGYDMDGSNGWSASWLPVGLTDLTDIGFYVYAWDAAGNGAGHSVLHLNMGDSLPPASAIQKLPANLDSTLINVVWQGTDDLSGIASYDLQVQVDGGAWQDWLTGIASTQTSAAYYAQFGKTYGFRIRARDQAGNLEAYPASAETSVYVNPCSTDAFEADNTLATAKPLESGKIQQHTFCGLNDVDWLSFPVQAGKSYLFWTSLLGPQTNTWMGLYLPNGTLIKENKNIGNNPASLVYQAVTTGTVYLKIYPADGRIAGNAVTYSVQAGPATLHFLPQVYR